MNKNDWHYEEPCITPAKISSLMQFTAKMSIPQHRFNTYYFFVSKHVKYNHLTEPGYFTIKT